MSRRLSLSFSIAAGALGLTAVGSSFALENKPKIFPQVFAQEKNKAIPPIALNQETSMPIQSIKGGALSGSVAALTAIKRVWDVLGYYGFNESQRQDLEFVMKKSGIPTDFLRSEARNDEELLQNIIKFVELTQKHFTIRTGLKERWEVEIAEWMKNQAHQKELMGAIERLGIVDEVLPKNGTDVMAILGARKSAMTLRLSFAGNLFNKGLFPAKHLVLLSGERYATLDKGSSIDGTPEELNQIAQKSGKGIKEITETDLMRDSYEKSSLYNKLPLTHIDTKRDNLSRPNTETTVRDLCIWLKSHPEFKKITFVSNQPHVDYQKAVIVAVVRAMLRKEALHHVEVEVVGPSCRLSPKDNVDPANRIKDLIGAVGSKVFAETPGVVEKLNLKIENPSLKKQFIDLYDEKQLSLGEYAKSILNGEPKLEREPPKTRPRI